MDWSVFIEEFIIQAQVSIPVSLGETFYPGARHVETRLERASVKTVI
jgi:hypothetical protein